jgi:hypothetical protein
VLAAGAGSGGVLLQAPVSSAPRTQTKRKGTASRLGGGEASTRCLPPLSEHRASR